MFRAKEFVFILVIVLIAGVLGIGSVASSILISQDGVFWVQAAQDYRSLQSGDRLPKQTGYDWRSFPVENLSDSKAGWNPYRRYLFYPYNGQLGISVDTNGIAVFERQVGYFPVLAVYQKELGTSWHHIAVTYEDKQAVIYLNGRQVRTGLVSDCEQSFSAAKTLGGHTSSSVGNFKGLVRDVQIWNRALSAEEVREVADGVLIDQGMACHWPFNEGAGTKLDDKSGNGHQAIIKGARWIDTEEDRALQFDGVQDTVVLNYPTLEDSFSIAVRVRVEAGHISESLSLWFWQIQDIGFPWMINHWHRLLSLFGLGQENRDWLLAGQTFCLLCRLLSVIPLYFLGRRLVGGRYAFWALIILVCLPWPAEWGHDVLREWPHLLFLGGGLFMVLRAFESGRVFYLLPAGVMAGAGHTIRPEAAQVILYALVGLILALLRPEKMKFSRKQSLTGALWLIGGFAVIALPYLHAKGYAMPQKLDKLLSMNVQDSSVVMHSTDAPNSYSTSAGNAFASLEGVIDLVQDLCENFYYYFFPFMLMGLYRFLVQPRQMPFEKPLLIAFIVINTLMLTTLYHNWGYITRRHVLPLTAMTVFFVPQGLQCAAALLSRKKTEPAGRGKPGKQGRMFGVMMCLGILVCLPKLAKPQGSNIGFRKTADYLRLKTPTHTIIAVPDPRIGFYAERTQIPYEVRPPSGEWEYIVIHEKNSKIKSDGPLIKIYSHPLRLDRDSGDAVIYRRAPIPRTDDNKSVTNPAS